jgi:hypothetical protein
MRLSFIRRILTHFGIRQTFDTLENPGDIEPYQRPPFSTF